MNTSQQRKIEAAPHHHIVVISLVAPTLLTLLGCLIIWLVSRYGVMWQVYLLILIGPPVALVLSVALLANALITKTLMVLLMGCGFATLVLLAIL